MLNRQILNNLICIKCSGLLNVYDNKLICRECAKEYQITNNKLFILNEDNNIESTKNDFIFNEFKKIFKKHHQIFNILYYLFGASFVGKNVGKCINCKDKNKIIVNLGSGVRMVKDNIINIDFSPYNNVDMVADIANLPFPNNSIDVVVIESVLEHVPKHQAIISEIKRILKSEGFVYVTVPFVAAFHSSPNDYYRWSKEGFRELMHDFEEVECGIRHGPTSAMLSIFNEWLATLFSFGSKYLHQFLLILFTIISSPLKILDYLISKFPSAQNIAFGFYYIGKKK
ncbi:MAG: class I SAM-dependent methyltransferase [Candidatus Portnoybacteria bacterium]|nr:class I SAM-dependent methyltransferase [Candidatus Portnoybacteria bacterium]HPH52024.1 class I SAM-dependent methyltransferase [Candidatus Portnoybacteria bacterium]